MKKKILARLILTTPLGLVAYGAIISPMFLRATEVIVGSLAIAIGIATVFAWAIKNA